MSTSNLEKLCTESADCQGCPLSSSRCQVVFGSGNPNASILFVGDFPEETEDQQGLPFVGVAGQLLRSFLRRLGLESEDVYFTNIVKCHPKDRDPKAAEVDACFSILEKQIQLIQPDVIVALGRLAAKKLTRRNLTLEDFRKNLRFYGPSAIPVVVTYHPRHLILYRSKPAFQAVWADLRKAHTRSQNQTMSLDSLFDEDPQETKDEVHSS